LAHSDKIALQVAEGMLDASNLSCNIAKSRGLFYFSCNLQPNYEFFLATCKDTFVALQVAKKIASCNMAFRNRLISVERTGVVLWQFYLFLEKAAGHERIT